MASNRRVSGEGPTFVVDHAYATAPGAREENQDRVTAGERFGVLSDGVGGHAGGAAAAQLTVDTVVAHLGSLGHPPEAQDLVDAVAHANAAVRAQRERDPMLARMGATVTLAVAAGVAAGGSDAGPAAAGSAGGPPAGSDAGAAGQSELGTHPGGPGGDPAGTARWLVANAGDSPAWLVSAGGTTRLTREHTVAAELVRAGVLEPEDAATHPGRHMLAKAVGPEERVVPDVVEVTLVRGDALVLASDGVTDVLDDEAVGRLVGAAAGAEDAADALVDAALRAGTTDNVTTVVLRQLAFSGHGFAIR